MKEKVLFYARKFVIFIIAVMSLLTLCFTFIEVSGEEIITYEGFKMLPFNNSSLAFSASMIIVGAVILVLFILSLMLILTSILNIFIKGNKIDLIVITIALLSAIIYMSLAVTFVSFTIKSLANATATYHVFTAAYVPLIIQAVLTCAYCIFLFFENRLANPTAFVKKKKSASTTSYIEDLKQLKELFDAQIINQEEFDAKKKEILGL